MSWGLTKDGFHRPGYNDLLDGLEIRARELFGSTIDLSVRSPLGIFCRIYAWIGSKIWQTAESVYLSAYADTATGQSLFRLGSNIGITPLPAQKATGMLSLTGTPKAEVPAGLLYATQDKVQFVGMQDTTLDADGKGMVPVQAVLAGVTGNVAAGTVTRIATPHISLDEVTNASAMTGGHEKETEEQFRDRYFAVLNGAGGVNADAIRAAILEVEHVTACIVLENDTDTATSDGMPAHSVECIVYGGENADIAQAIYKKKAAGIITYGSTAVSITDASGQTKAIRLSRPTARNVWVKVDQLIVDADQFPSDGDTQIVNAVLNFIGADSGSVSSDGLTIGENVRYTRLFAPINAVPGVLDYELSISSDGQTYGRDNITVDKRSKAVTAAGKVTVIHAD